MKKIWICLTWLSISITAKAQITPDIEAVAKKLGFSIQFVQKNQAVVRFSQFTAKEPKPKSGSSGIKRWKVENGKTRPAKPGESADFESEELSGGTPRSVTAEGGSIPLGVVHTISVDPKRNLLTVIAAEGTWFFSPSGGYTTAARNHPQGDTVSMYQFLDEIINKK